PGHLPCRGERAWGENLGGKPTWRWGAVSIPPADMKKEKKLLVIEDETAILMFLRSSLPRAGWELLEATTARVGLDLAAKSKPDVILLDLGLPDQDGIETLKTLRKWTSAPVIIISARGQEIDKIRGLDA